MSTQTEKWPAGTPAWVDLGVDDLPAAKAFYSELFGWDYLSGDEEAGGYLLAQLDGQAVGGTGPQAGFQHANCLDHVSGLGQC
ncbi:hypothetical protein VUN82_24215 [Micrococcaceae bacterium Sec5.1]